MEDPTDLANLILNELNRKQVEIGVAMMAGLELFAHLAAQVYTLKDEEFIDQMLLLCKTDFLHRTTYKKIQQDKEKSLTEEEKGIYGQEN